MCRRSNEGMLTIRRLSGDPLPLDLPEGATAVSAKRAAALIVGVPAANLRIVEDLRECQNEERLYNRQSLTLVVKLEEALRDLHLSDEEDPLHRRRSGALLFLYAHAPRDDARTMSRIGAAFGKASTWVRPDTVAADAEHLAGGDGRSILGAVALLADPDPEVRRAATEAIATLCGKCDDLALRAVAWQLVPDITFLKRQLALEALVGESSQDERTGIDVAGIEAWAMGNVAWLYSFMPPASAPPPSQYVPSLSAGVEHWLSQGAGELRRLAAGTFGSESQRPPPWEECHDRGEPVTMAKLDALAKTIGIKASKPWRFLRRESSTGRDDVRCAILDVLEARVNDPNTALDVLAVKLEDPSPDIRAIALLLVWALRRKGDNRAIEITVPRLVDEQRAVKHLAVQVLLALSEKGDFYTFQSLACVLKDPDPCIRGETVRAMAAISDAKDGRTVDLLHQVLRHSTDPNEAQAALSALSESSPPDDLRVRQIILEYREFHPVLAEKTIHHSIFGVPSRVSRAKRPKDSACGSEATTPTLLSEHTESDRCSVNL